MPIKEQFSRVWLMTMLVTYGAYFAAVVAMGEAGFWSQMAAFIATVIVQVAALGIAGAIMELRHKGGPKADERDRAIDQRATRTAYHVLMAGVIILACVMPFSETGWRLFHAGVFAIAMAEIVRHGQIVLLYRRGWHG